MPDSPAGQLRDRIAAALSTAGAFCGECGFEPGETGCPDCVRVREVYADALLAVVQPDLDRLTTIRQLARALGDYLPGDGWELAHAIERLAAGEITPAEALAETDG